ncbi:MAG: MMPL family transporter [Spirochaetia bacterium]|nr:MMPL family transporter [Spirochaetia bacterium]
MKSRGWLSNRIFFLLLLVAVFVGALLRGVQIDTSFFSLFPEYSKLSDVENKISHSSSSAVYILTESIDFDSAKKGAEAFCNAFPGSDVFKSLTLHQDPDSIEELKTFLFEHRYQLMDEETVAELEKGNVDELSKAALSQVYSPFSFADLSHLDKDPFLLVGRSLKKYAFHGVGNMFMKDGVLAAESDGKWYVLIRGYVTDEALSFSKKNGIGSVYEKIKELEHSNAGVSYICSGVPFHSYESSSKAMKEISWITGASLALVALIIFLAFRSLFPMLISLANIAVSLLFGLAVVLIVYGRVNALALVFGTTLIGVSIDYSIHFFVNREHIFRSLTINCISTEISWCLLMLAPFPLLRQIALFSAAGLLCSYLIVRFFYPAGGADIRQHDDKTHDGSCYPDGGQGSGHLLRVAGIVVLVICFAAPVVSGIRIRNNIKGMYTMSGQLLEWEKKAASVLKLGSTGEYFIVSGRGQQELLAQEEQLASRLEKEKNLGNIGGYTAISTFVPSMAHQARSYKASELLLQRSRVQLKALGFGSAAAEQFALDHQSKAGMIVTLKDVPAFMNEQIDALYLGKVGDSYYSVVFPLQVHNSAALQNLADGRHIFFMSKVSDIEKELDHLTRIALIFILASYLLVFPFLCLIYGKKALRIALVPVAVILASLAFVSASGGGVDFFACAGIVLIFGLGLDYLVYGLEKKTGKATLLSFITTEISFGALALSSFVPAHVFGLTVCAGLALAYFLSLLIGRS